MRHLIDGSEQPYQENEEIGSLLAEWDAFLVYYRNFGSETHLSLVNSEGVES